MTPNSTSVAPLHAHLQPAAAAGALAAFAAPRDADGLADALVAGQLSPRTRRAYASDLAELLGALDAWGVAFDASPATTSTPTAPGWTARTCPACPPARPAPPPPSPARSPSAAASSPRPRRAA